MTEEDIQQILRNDGPLINPAIQRLIAEVRKAWGLLSKAQERECQLIQAKLENQSLRELLKETRGWITIVEYPRMNGVTRVSILERIDAALKPE